MRAMSPGMATPPLLDTVQSVSVPAGRNGRHWVTWTRQAVTTCMLTTKHAAATQQLCAASGPTWPTHPRYIAHLCAGRG